jgi:hypothetical protein
MILIDGNNLAQRMLHVANSELFVKNFDSKGNLKEEITKTQYNEFLIVWINLIMNEILNLKANYPAHRSKIVVAFDSQNVWRKKIYPVYKSNRKKGKRTPQDGHLMKVFYKFLPILYKVLESTSFITLKDLYVDEMGIEADDIIATLTQRDGKHLISSCDSDFTQILDNRILQYHPFRKAIVATPSKEDVRMWLEGVAIDGQGKDGVPNILHEVSLSKDFIKWMKEKENLEVDDTHIPQLLSGSYMKMYEDEKAQEDVELISSGKRKTKRNLIAFEKPNGGNTLINKVLKDKSFLDLNPKYKEHYERNKRLMWFYYIPQEIQDHINQTFDSLSKPKVFNTIECQNMLMKIGCKKLLERIAEF